MFKVHSALTIAAMALACASPAVEAAQAFSVVDFGAVPNTTSAAEASSNAAAFVKAIAAASQAGSGAYAVVPAGLQFDLLPVLVTGQRAASLVLLGNISAHANISDWGGSKKVKFPPLLRFESCWGVSLSGPGFIAGNGYDWWWARLFSEYSYAPNLVEIADSSGVRVTGVTTENSPRFNFNLKNVSDVEISGVTIWTDVEGQREMLVSASMWDLDSNFPTFPLNTDGIDIDGRDVYVHDVEVTNWDDSLCVKPGKVQEEGCSQNHTYENAIIHFGVGASIGSIPPSDKINCVRDITFRNISFDSPTKAIYLKSNGGDTGSAIVENVHYEDIKANGSIWYPIYMGPQQQQEPDGRGDGWWPATNPLVSFRNISIVNATFENVIWPQAGVLRCNASNPCIDILLDNVSISGWNATEWVCEHTIGEVIGVTPVPQCMVNSTRKQS
jgi:polygalacturonase